MIPSSALLYSGETSLYKKKLAGSYPLERNIRLLWQAGVKKIHLQLSEEEHDFYLKHIEKKIKKLRDITIEDTAPKKEETYLEIPSNQFLQYHNLTSLNTYFIKKGKKYIPHNNQEIFLLREKQDFSKAEKLAVRHIVANTSGFIARKLNKPQSIPLSRLLVRTGIHPNILTIINILIGITSAVCIMFDSYYATVLGGFLFQFASVFDGCDGEVAKLSCRFSKFGGALDTFGDHLSLILVLIAISYQYYLHTPGLIILVVISILFSGIAVLMIAEIWYLTKYSESRSFIAYDKEFLQKIPRDSSIVKFVLNSRYLIKKEFYSYVIFLTAVTGKIYYLIPIYAVIIFVGAVLLLIINKRYLSMLPFDEKHEHMTYTSLR